MQNSQNKKTLQIVLLVLVAVLTISIGYASITAINLIINGNATASVNQNNFIVHFIEAKNITGTTGVGGTSVVESDDTKASFNVTGLSKVGDYAEAKYVVKNDSNGIGAEITLELTNSNSEYFKVTETIDDNKLQAGDTTLATVKVEMIKTPLQDISTNVVAKLKADPIENDSASGNSSESISQPTPFAIDSWSTIKTNVQNGNTSQYNVGDEKTVTINNVNYTVRLVNKTIEGICNNEEYSETACGFVVEFKDIITTMQMNAGTYSLSEIRTYLNNDLFFQFSSDLQNSIIETRVKAGKHGSGVTSDIDKIYLLSHKEIVNGSKGYEYDVNLSRQLDYYKNNGVYLNCHPYSGCGVNNYNYTIKRYNGEETDWWMRTADGYTQNKIYIASDFSSGRLSSSFFGVSPAFRIG